MTTPAPHRKRLRRFEIPHQARFLTFSCHQRLPLFQNDRIKRPFVSEIDEARHRTGFRVLAWVIMPEHVHMVIVPKLPAVPVSRITSALKSRFARTVLNRWRALHAPVVARLTMPNGETRFWLAGGGYDRNPRSSDEMWEKIDYCHRNPVTRGLVERPIDYAWSSAMWYAGLRDGAMLAIDSVDS